MFNDRDMADVLTATLKTVSETVAMLHDLSERIDQAIYDMGAGEVLETMNHDLCTFYEVAQTVAGTLRVVGEMAARTERPELVTHTTHVREYLDGEIVTFIDMLKEHGMWQEFMAA